MQRIGIFVNVTNQFGALTQKKKGFKVNYQRFLQHFTGDDEKLILAYAYGSQIADEANSFIYALKGMGYLTKFVTSIKNNREIIHPNRNVEMTVDIMSSCERLDIVVLGTNDSELVPLIHYLQTKGIKVIVASPVLSHNAGNTNIDLLNSTDLVENIQLMREKK